MKRVSTHGKELLTELKKDRKDFRNGMINNKEARSIAQLGNTTCRAIRETVSAMKFEKSEK